MERPVRAHFRVIRINRWGVALVLLIALALLLLPSSKYLAVFSQGNGVVRPGVRLGKRDFTNKTEAEAKDMLTKMAANFRAEPQPATVEWQEGVSYVNPELDGYELDVENTWRRLVQAPANTEVEPATRVHTPSKRLSDFPQSVIRQGNAAKPAVGLFINIDLGHSELDVSAMLAALKRRGAHATFFISGRWAEKFPTLVKLMTADGHEIASHGYDLSRGPLELAQQGKLRADIAKSVDVIQRITGVPIRYYAPHKSEISPEIIKAAGDLKLRTVLYSVDTVDWQAGTTPDKIMGTIRTAKPGDLILMHPTPKTAQVLEQAVMYLQAQGLAPVTLSTVLNPEPDTSSAALRVR